MGTRPDALDPGVVGCLIRETSSIAALITEARRHVLDRFGVELALDMELRGVWTSKAEVWLACKKLLRSSGRMLPSVLIRC